MREKLYVKTDILHLLVYHHIAKISKASENSKSFLEREGIDARPDSASVPLDGRPALRFGGVVGGRNGRCHEDSPVPPVSAGHSTEAPSVPDGDSALRTGRATERRPRREQERPRGLSGILSWCPAPSVFGCLIVVRGTYEDRAYGQYTWYASEYAILTGLIR